MLPGPNDEPTLFPGRRDGISERTRELVDDEARRILEEAPTRPSPSSATIATSSKR